MADIENMSSYWKAVEYNMPMNRITLGIHFLNSLSGYSSRDTSVFSAFCEFVDPWNI